MADKQAKEKEKDAIDKEALAKEKKAAQNRAKKEAKRKKQQQLLEADSEEVLMAFMKYPPLAKALDDH